MIPPWSMIEGLAILVIHNLNQLYSEPCCAMCCAPCDWLRRVSEDGDVLEEIISNAPEQLRSPWLGDDVNPEASDGQRIDRDWLNSRWHCQSDPVCETTWISTFGT